ncbi:uncharacterized protein LOC136092111 [Hydra vulgaris]|uniref:Uncharacterized protein LOC136092111 n=1 Tax=Hydra vulgaris TaxID=6087 RepID=A0ABM4DMV7_HYDVU
MSPVITVSEEVWLNQAKVLFLVCEETERCFKRFLVSTDSNLPNEIGMKSAIASAVLRTKIQSGIIKTDLTDHFPVFLIIISATLENKIKTKTVYIRKINNESIATFRDLLHEVNWELLTDCNDVNDGYNFFIRMFTRQYEKAFPKIKKIVNSKNLLSPWMTRGLIKSSKRKQKLYQKFLKKKNYKNETKYKKYKKSFEKLKKQSKKNYYSSLLNKTFGNARKTWNVIKEITGVGIVKSDNLPKRLQRDDKRGDAFVNKEIAETFNSFFINIGKKLAGAIPEGKKSFKSFLKKSDSFMDESELLIDELRLAISMLKTNKSAGLDEVNPDVVKAVSDIIEKPLFKIFNLSLKTGIFPDQLKLAKIIPIYKGGDDSIKSNYRPISILSCFSKILDTIKSI